MTTNSTDIGPAGRDNRDPRVQRTRAALLKAFNLLFLAIGYDAITPQKIAVAASVGRATFYEHYASKDALFSESATAVLQPLAEAAAGRGCPMLTPTLHHFWENRRLVSRMLTGKPAIILRRRLAELITDVLATKSHPETIPLPILSTGMAASRLAMLELWVSGRFACTVEQLALALTS